MCKMFNYVVKLFENDLIYNLLTGIGRIKNEYKFIYLYIILNYEN